MRVISDDLDIADLRALREQQIENLNEPALTRHEVVAFWAGFPPSATGIVTPEELRNALVSGNLDPSEAPIAQAQVYLEDTFGPREELDLKPPTSDFSSASSEPDLENAPENSFIPLDPTKTVT